MKREERGKKGTKKPRRGDVDWEAAVALGPRPGCAWLSGRGLAPEGLLYSPAVWAISDFPIIKFKKIFF